MIGWFAARVVGGVIVEEEVFGEVGEWVAALVVGVVGVGEELVLVSWSSWSSSGLVVIALLGRLSFLNLPNLYQIGRRRGLLSVSSLASLSGASSGLELGLALGVGVAVGVVVGGACCDFQSK